MVALTLCGESASPAASAVGIDLGGTKVGGVVVDPQGRVTGRLTRHHDGSASGALATALAVADDLSTTQPRPDRVGFAVAGLVDRRTEELVHGALLGLSGVRVGSLMADRIGLPVLVENDANATLAAVLDDKGGEPQTVLLVTLGTGVGGAVAVDGVIVEGSSGFAGEIGHIPVGPPGGPVCPCGSNRCLELVASGTAIGRIARESGLSATGDAADVVRAAHAGDAAAITILDSAGAAVGAAVIGLVNALDPAAIYLAGGFGHAAAPFLIPAVERRLRAQWAFASWRRPPRILAHPAGPSAAALGAARLAQRHNFDNSPRIRKGHL